MDFEYWFKICNEMILNSQIQAIVNNEWNRG